MWGHCYKSVQTMPSANKFFSLLLLMIYECVDGICGHNKVMCGKDRVQVCNRLLSFFSIADGDPRLLDGESATVLSEIFCMPADGIPMADTGLTLAVVSSDVYYNTVLKANTAITCVACAKIAALVGAKICDWNRPTFEALDPTPLAGWEAVNRQDGSDDVRRATVFASVIVGMAKRWREVALEVVAYMLNRRKSHGLEMSPLPCEAGAQLSEIRAELRTLAVWLQKVIACASPIFLADRTLQWSEWNNFKIGDPYLFDAGLKTRRWVEMYMSRTATGPMYMKGMAETKACCCGVSWYVRQVQVGNATTEWVYCCLANLLTAKAGCRLITAVLIQ